MKALLICLLLTACGLPPVVTGHENDDQESPEAGNVAPTPATTTTVFGVWFDYGSCNGAQPTGLYASDFAFNHQQGLGVVPLACRPADGQYKASCAVGANPFDCTVTVRSGGVSLTSHTASPGMNVSTGFAVRTGN